MDSMLGTDWREAWRIKFEANEQPGDSACWDERSTDFSMHSGVSRYVETFLSYLELEPGWSVLDMGTGPGTIARPLAQAGHEVLAADFSEGMLQEATKRAISDGLENFQTKKLDWNEDWEAAGIMPKSFDAVVASRSTIVSDLGEALLKMDRTARSLAVLSMTTEHGPRSYKQRGSKQDTIEEYLDDYIYCMNILFQMGAYPELKYIDTNNGKDDDYNRRFVRWAYISWKPLFERSDDGKEETAE